MKKLLVLSVISTCFVILSTITQAVEDETDIMGVCPTKIVTGNGAITVNYSEEGKMIAYYTPNVGSYNIIPYQTTTNKNDTIRYGAQPYEGLFAGIEINGNFKWLHQLYPTVIKYNNDNSPEILIQYTYPTANGSIYIDQTCIVGSPETHPKVAVESYKIRNSSTQQVSVKFIYYGFIHPTITNQQAPLYIYGVQPLGWQFLSPITTKAKKKTNYIEVGPDSTSNGQYFNFGVTLNNETTLHTFDKTIFSDISPLTSGIYSDYRPDFNWPLFNSSFSSGVKVNWAARYDLGILESSGGEKTINCFLATGVDENWANLNLNNAISFGFSLFKNSFTQWWENQIDLTKINNTFSDDVEKKLFKRWLITSRIMVDNETGAIIASPNRQPKYYSTWVRDGMYQALFWEAWDRTDIVDKFINFLISIAEEQTLPNGKTLMYWQQCYAIKPNIGEQKTYTGFPWCDGDIYIDRPNLKIENDQMGTFLSLLYIVAKNRNYSNPRMVVDDSLFNTIDKVANWIENNITTLNDAFLNRGKKAHLLQPSFDFYEFPASGDPLDVFAAFNDPNRAAISQSIYTNSAATAGLRSAGYLLNNNSDRYYWANQISEAIKGTTLWNPNWNNFTTPALVYKGNFGIGIDCRIFNPNALTASTRYKLHNISVGWPYNVYGMSDATTKNYSQTVETFLNYYKNTNKIFVPLYLMSAIYDLYKPEGDNSDKIEEIKNLVYDNHQGIWFVPENIHSNGPNDYWGQGATPLGWSQAWGALALLLKQKNNPNDRDLILPIFDLGGPQINTPSAPNPISPTNSATNISLTPTFVWSDVLNKSLSKNNQGILRTEDSVKTNIESIIPGYWLQYSFYSNFNYSINYQGIRDSFYTIEAGNLNSNTPYFWRVKAVNNNGDTSSWSSTFNFTTSPVAGPPQPRLISPNDNATNVSLTTMLDWNDTSNVNSYKVQISISSTFNSSVIDTTVPSNPSQFSIPSGKLIGNNLYYWHVQGINTSSGSSPFSTTWKFTTISTPGSCQRPQLTEPTNGATGLSITPQLKWAAVSGATSYTMVLANNPAFNNLILEKSGISTTNYSVPPDTLKANKTYYWRVYTACSGNQYSNWSDTYSFTTSSYQVPGMPDLTSPNNGAVNQTLDVTLNWIDVINASTYNVQVATDENFNNVIIYKTGLSLSEYTFTVGELSYQTAYYWRASASNSLGTGKWSSYRYFTTLEVTPPAAPVHLYPADNSINQPLTPTLDWTDVVGATKYRIQVSTNPGFTSFVIDDPNAANSYYFISQGVLNNNIKYYWRVSAYGSGVYSNYSSPWSFTTLIATSPPTAPTLIHPSDGSTNLSLSFTLKWSTVVGASKYRCMVSTDSSFSSAVLDVSNIDSTQYTIPSYLLSYNNKYYWRVSAINAAGLSSWSTVWNLSTMVQPLIQQPTNIDLINFGQIIDIKIQNQFAYCLTEAGLFRVNIEDPYHTYIKNSISLPSGLNNSCKLVLKDDYAYISNGTSGITIINISVPDYLDLTSNLTGIGEITEIAVKDSALFALRANSDFVSVISIKDPVNPYYITQFNATSNYNQRVYCVASTNKFLFFGGQNGRIYRWRITNPYNPDVFTHVLQNTNVSTFGQFLLDEVNNHLFTQENNGDVYTYSVNLSTGQLTSITQSPKIISDTGPFWLHHMAKVGNLLYLTSFGDTWTKIWDVTNISTPVYAWKVEATPNNYVNALGIALTNGYCFLGTSGKLLIFPLNYNLSISRLDVSGNFNDVKIKGNNLFAAAGTKGLLVYDMTNRANPIQISNLNFEYAVERIYIDSSNYIYCIANEKVYIVNISNPTSPIIVSSFSIPYKVPGSNQNCYIKDIVVKNNFAYVFFMYRVAYTIPNLEEKGMAVVNLNNITSPTLSGKFYFNDDSRNVAAMLMGNDIYSIERRYYAEGVGGSWSYTGVNKIAKYSISNPTNPALIAVKNITDNPMAFDFIDNKFYVVTGWYQGYSDPSLSTIKFININNFDIEKNISLDALPSFVKVSENNIFLTKGNEFNIFERDTSLTFVENKTFPYGAGRFAIDNNYVNLSNNYSMTTFTINNQISPPSTPQLVNPVNGASDISVTPTLDWTDIDGARTYGVQVSSDINFSNIILNQAGIIPSQIYIPANILYYNNLYYWRVVASNEGGASSWSDIWSFNTVLQPPSQPTLISPANDSIIVSLIPKLNWQDSPDALSYRLQVATISSLENSSIIIDSSGIGSSHITIPFDKLNYNTQYYWRVKATNIGGEGEWSSAWGFTTKSGINLQTTLLIEGFYNSTNESMSCGDTLRLELRTITSPYFIIDSSLVVIDTLGQGIARFGSAETGDYYLVIKHRNTIETWSKSGGEQLMKGTSTSYDFTSDSSIAFGFNMIKKGARWCIYSGDVNQDGVVDSTDLTLISNDAFNYATGYRSTDINGDNFIDLNDIIICDDNAFNSVSAFTPVLMPIVKPEIRTVSK